MVEVLEHRYSGNDLVLLFREVFRTGRGAEALEALESRFRRPPLVPSGCGDGSAIVPLTMVRVGEENVIRYIHAILNKTLEEAEEEGDGSDEYTVD